MSLNNLLMRLFGRLNKPVPESGDVSEAYLAWFDRLYEGLYLNAKGDK